MEDLQSLSLKDLKKLQEKVEKEIAKRSDQSRKTLHKKILKLAEAEGLDINEFLPRIDKEPQPRRKKAPVVKAKASKVKAPKTPKAPKAPKAPAQVAPKYFSRIDPNITWSGRGRQPEWVRTWIENGGMLEELITPPW